MGSPGKPCLVSDVVPMRRERTAEILSDERVQAAQAAGRGGRVRTAGGDCGGVQRHRRARRPVRGVAQQQRRRATERPRPGERGHLLT